MIKKFLIKLIKWESPSKSNWTREMEAKGLDNVTRKQIMEEAREKLRQEQERLKQQVKKQEEPRNEK